MVEYHNYSKHVVEKHGFISYVQGITNQGRDGCIRISNIYVLLLQSLQRHSARLCNCRAQRGLVIVT